ncbi:MAG: hypothetical protein AAFR53_06075, partial [Pseudomonadota bacterium]
EVQVGNERWEGFWRGAGADLCYEFAQGPRLGKTCFQVEATSRGYLTSLGDNVRPVASAIRF